ncbi:MAG: hypothetical protein ACOYL5_06370 [Phototrophicaceae bacterium]|jgi:hypothetical protein
MQITITIPDDVAQDAAEYGLLSESRILALLRDALEQQRANGRFASGEPKSTSKKRKWGLGKAEGSRIIAGDLMAPLRPNDYWTPISISYDEDGDVP